MTWQDQECAESRRKKLNPLFSDLSLSLFSSLPFLLCLAMATPRSPSIRNFFIAAVLLLLIHGVSCFYLPGVAPEDFEKGDELKVKVNKLTSTKTQLPYSYYSLPFSRPEKILDSAENLGEVLRGDRIENSPYVVS
ncbi:Transmembrane 9 superfamily member 8, partial [Cucurbita argyrosperma subsp. argyrosperma]